jgi:hypothetical protein
MSNRYLTKAAAMIRVPMAFSGITEAVVGNLVGTAAGMGVGHMYDKKKHGKKYDSKKHNTGATVGAALGGVAGGLGGFRAGKADLVVNTSTGETFPEKSKLNLGTSRLGKAIDTVKRKYKMHKNKMSLHSDLSHGTVILNRIRKGMKTVKPVLKIVK